MNAKQERMLLAAICLLLVLVSLGSLGWAAAVGMLRDIDGLLLALVALLGALIFGAQAYSLLKAALPRKSGNEKESSGGQEPDSSSPSSTTKESS
jgi:hypothetical protein